MTQSRENNPNWRGGRIVSEHGYALVRVGTEHHLSDVRGYAYEHRVVAEQKIGRELKPGEMVHHINGNKQDNRPENLEVVGDTAEHFFLHRKLNTGLKKPGEENPEIECACGCKRKFYKYDSSGRPRFYVSGHNPQIRTTMDMVLHCLLIGPLNKAQLSSVCGKSKGAIGCALRKLRKLELVERQDSGIWKLIENEEVIDG
jgi:hypothetical protein